MLGNSIQNNTKGPKKGKKIPPTPGGIPVSSWAHTQYPPRKTGFSPLQKVVIPFATKYECKTCAYYDIERINWISIKPRGHFSLNKMNLISCQL